jgi:hypothetical protein
MKRTIVTAALLGSFFLASCSNSAAVGLVTQTDFAKISKDQKSLNSLLVLDMTSSMSLLNNSNLSLSGLARMLNSSEASSEQTTSLPQDSISQMLSSIDLLLSNDFGFAAEEVKSSNPSYSYQTDVSFTLLDGKKETYSLFFNSAKEERESEASKTETEVSINGECLVDSLTYTFTLISETETSENGENESEVAFKLMKDTVNYIEVKNSIETEEGEKELEYEYRKITEGVEETAYELSFENEDQKEEVELEKDNKEYKITSAEADGITLLSITEKNKDTGEKISYVYQRVIEEKDGKTAVSYIPYVK